MRKAKKQSPTPANVLKLFNKQKARYGLIILLDGICYPEIEASSISQFNTRFIHWTQDNLSSLRRSSVRYFVKESNNPLVINEYLP